MSTATEIARRAIKSWIAIEVLTPNTVKDWNDFVEKRLIGSTLQKREAERAEFQWRSPAPNSRHPWLKPGLSGKEETPGTGTTAGIDNPEKLRDWYIIVLGAIPVKPAYERLKSAFTNTGGEEEDEERREPYGFVLGATLVLNEEGIPASETPNIASFAWGLGQVLKNGPKVDFTNWEKVEQSLQMQYKDLIAPLDANGRRRPLYWRDLYEISANFKEDFALPADLWQPLPIVLKVTSKFAPEQDLLSGFYLGDLTRILSEVDRLPRAAAQYMQLLPPKATWDPLTDRSKIKELLHPMRFPLARWPIPGLYPLTLLQQAAVNHIVQDLTIDGLAAVNGPPGTGKTTSLRDLVAHVITLRAAKLVMIQDPSDGKKLKGLLDFGIVVASSNNAAVDNISQELPVREKALDQSIWLNGGLDHFAGTASHALDLKPDLPAEQKAWGLIAARLGNRSNISDFFGRFWTDDNWGLKGWFIDAAFPAKAGSKRPPRGALHQSNPPPAPAAAAAAWRAAREDFLKAQELCNGLRRSLAEHINDLDRITVLKAQYDAAGEQIKRIGEKLSVNNKLTAAHSATLDDMIKSLSEKKVAASIIASTRPPFWHRWLNTSAWKEYLRRIDVTFDDLSKTKNSYELKLAEQRGVISGGKILADELKEVQSAHYKTGAEGRTIEERLLRARQRWGSVIPDQDHWDSEHDMFHTSSPWNGGEFRAARDALFVAALRLHYAFYGAAARPLKFALDKVINDLKGGSNPDEKKPDEDDWGLFFTLIPVISTTFASCSRMLRSITAGQIGWLLIDEAGQACPQYALGAIWRSKRAVVIGDPLQIEPFSELPRTISNKLFKNNGIEPNGWSAPKESTQTLADRASIAQGRFLDEVGGNKDGFRYTGLPLLVHRRCEEPMFTISNTIAYAGQMVHATNHEKSPIGEILGPSTWIEIEGNSEDKWVKEEGYLICQALLMLSQRLGTAPDVYVICPFRKPSFRLSNMLANNRLFLSGMQPKDRWRWINSHIGTVHTFQGKEAEAVILMLGAGQGAKPGSRNWAGGTPNILNVAATRAKRRLYLVGNRRLWVGAGVFQEAARMLPNLKAADWRQKMILPTAAPEWHEGTAKWHEE